MPSLLQIRLLGGMRISYGDAPVTGVNTPRLQSLLAYLMLSGGAPQLRLHVAFTLWPDTSESNARNSLRQLLHQLRQSLPDPDRFMAVDGNTICWQKGGEQSVDVWTFESALAEAEAAERGGDVAAAARAWEQAVASYQGDLLPACYDDWIAAFRDDLRLRHRHACEKLVRLLEDGRRYEAALKVAERLLSGDPLDEEAPARLMRLHALNGDRAAVRRTFQTADLIFRRELGQPAPVSLRELYERLARVPHGAARARTIAGGEANAAALVLVGRQDEWRQLQAAWRRTGSGEAQLVLIGGEAGIGKSRLAEELYAWVSRQGLAAAYARSYGAEGRLSLSPVTEWLRSPALRVYWEGLDRAWLAEISRLLPELPVERPDLAAPPPIVEAGGRQRFFEALARAVLSAPPPVLLWIDDLHWCDQETLDWLHFLLRFARDRQMLVLGTARSEESPADHPLSALERQLRSEGKLTRVELTPLDAAETALLAAQVVGQHLDDRAAIRLYRETEGNPLFVVETVRSGLASLLPDDEAGALTEFRTGAAPALPPRVHAVIAGRLAKLSPPAARVAEIGSAVGRAFSLEVLLEVEKEREESVVNALDELWQKRVIRELRPGEFDFTHDKLREVALAALSPPQRRLYHRKIAQALETLESQDLDPVSAQIASQYEQAGLAGQAIPYYQRAATAAARVYAHQDAIGSLRQALALLAQLPPGPRRDAQELVLLLALAPLYLIAKGWTSPEVDAVLNRALLLSDQVGDAGQRIQTLYGLQSLYVVAARLEKVEQTYAEMRDLFMKTHGEPPPAFSDLMHTGARFHMGHLVEARHQFEQIVALRDADVVTGLQNSQGVNYLVLGHAWNAHALWCLGYPDQALASAEAAVAFAREYRLPFNQALAATYLAMLQEMRAGVEIFRAQAEEALSLTLEYQAPYYHGWATILVSFAQGWLNPDLEGVQRLEAAIAALRATGVRLRLPYYLSLLARLWARAGRPDLGLAVIDQASTEALQNRERWWDAELHRLRGELLLARGAPPADVEAAFRRAIAVAQAQGARSLELRAATSLARLCRAAKCAAPAAGAVASAFGWFSEGYSTPDLQVASALL